MPALDCKLTGVHNKKMHGTGKFINSPSVWQNIGSQCIDNAY